MSRLRVSPGSRERVLLHQVHPIKLGADVGAAILSTELLWNGRTPAGLLVRYTAPPVASAAVLGFADVETLRDTRRGRYVLEHMPPTAAGIRLAGDLVMTMAATRRSWKLLLAGASLVAAGWSHGLLPRARVSQAP